MNIVSVSWADHLSFGEGDGRLETPEALARRMRAWREDLGAGALHWRMLRARLPGRFYAARGYRHPSQAAAQRAGWDDFSVVPALAREAGLEAWLYVSLFDEGWPLSPPRVRAVSHHNAMHGQHVAWQSDLTRRHPEWLVTDRSGRRRQWGVVCLGYKEARRRFVERWTALVDGTAFDGLFICLRSQSRPAEHGDQYGFNEPVREDFRARYGRDIREQDFDIQAWRDLLGEYLTRLLREVRDALRTSGHKFAVGVPRGDVIGPPLGNMTLAWRQWAEEHLVDRLIIDQNSSQCPSMWHQLWPMHRGSGYVQNYLDGMNLPPLDEHVAKTYSPLLRGSSTELFIARQWRGRSAEEERRLLAVPGVSGLVFSSFRYDNPAAIARGTWTAGRVTNGPVPRDGSIRYTR